MTKKEYRAYLASEHWLQARKEFIDNAENACERCHLPRWLAAIAFDQDLHVHHLSYQHVGNEIAKDVEVLCRRCHEIETFGHSQLRALRSANCYNCQSVFWNPYSKFCEPCRVATDPAYLLSTNQRTGRPVWARYIRQLTWIFGVKKIADACEEYYAGFPSQSFEPIPEETSATEVV